MPKWKIGRFPVKIERARRDMYIVLRGRDTGTTAFPILRAYTPFPYFFPGSRLTYTRLEPDVLDGMHFRYRRRCTKNWARRPPWNATLVNVVSRLCSSAFSPGQVLLVASRTVFADDAGATQEYLCTLWAIGTLRGHRN